MNKNIQGDFQICISVPLSYTCQNANFVVKFRTLEKQKLNFATGSTVVKVNIQHSEMVTKTFLRNVFTPTIVPMATVKWMIRIL